MTGKRKPYSQQKLETIVRIRSGKLTASEQAILQCLEQTPAEGWHVADLAERSGYNSKHAQTALMCLRLAGLAAYTGRGRGTRWCAPKQLRAVRLAQLNSAQACQARNDSRRAERAASPVLPDEPVQIVRSAADCEGYRGGPASVFALGARA